MAVAYIGLAVEGCDCELCVKLRVREKTYRLLNENQDRKRIPITPWFHAQFLRHKQLMKTEGKGVNPNAE